MEERDYRWPGEKVGICQMGPSTDGEGSAGVLGLNCVCVARRGQPLRKHGVDGVSGDRQCRMQHHLLPISPSFLSSKRRKCFLLDIAFRPLIVFSDQSSMMSACVLSTQM